MKLKNYILLMLMVSLTLQGCHYLPFLKYRSSKGEDNFPKFKDKHFYAGSDHSLRSAYDITCYDWAIEVQPEKKRIQGIMTIHFDATSSADTILLDMQSKLKLHGIEGSTSVKNYQRKGDLLYVIFSEPLTAGKNYRIDIDYSGKPASILSMGPVFWQEDKAGHPRVSTLTQGIGPHFVMPCKDLLYDEPDSCFIRLTVPEDLVGVANGKLIQTEQNDKKITYHYAVMNPINVYNISFNVAKFCQLDFPYTDIEGNQRTIEAQVLCEDSAKAHDFYAQTPAVMAELEALYGPFPWWNDGCRFVQSAISGGAMEHQSAISMGDILYNNLKSENKISTNSTLIHELAHEWWGNSITATDYGDAWLHEGMATFSEGLVAERLYGKGLYDRMLRRGYSMEINERPVIKPFGVRYNSWAHSPDYNIYSKGALFMHTLRMQVDNDSLFFAVFRSATGHFAKSNISTKDLEAFFSEHMGRNFAPFFDAYLRSNAIPALLMAVDTTQSLFYYKWEGGLPDGLEMFVILNFDEEEVKIFPGKRWQQIPIDKGKERSIERGKSGYFDVKRKEMTVVQSELQAGGDKP